MSRWKIGSKYDAVYKSFFDRAESHRRWRLDRDIAWDDQPPTASEHLVVLAETFWAVESFLPDYTAALADTFRSDRGRVWAHTMWAYEESKHSRALEEWLLRGGHRTEEDLDTLSTNMWAAGKWTKPHDTDRKLLIYQMLQESLTRLVYSRYRHMANEAGDKTLADLLRHLASDEQAHHGFFRDCVKLWLEDDPEGTTEDLYSVGMTFTMPAGTLIPDYAARDELLVKYELATPYLYITKVWAQASQWLGVDILPPPLRPLRDSGHSLDDIIRMLGVPTPADDMSLAASAG